MKSSPKTVAPLDHAVMPFSIKPFLKRFLIKLFSKKFVPQLFYEKDCEEAFNLIFLFLTFAFHIFLV
ncbi:MAG: hypothetical protein AAY43_05340 [Methanosarcina sp. 795]|nr:MAG: hypothetical protein AAY43_05340 [Methanosarcina sp. 795]